MKKRIAYVTGGMGHLGTAICQKLAQQGHIVIAGCGPHSPHSEAWLREQRRQGFDFFASEGDATDWDSTTAAFANARAQVGPIDILVNNVGGSHDMLFRQMLPEDWRMVIHGHLASLFNVTKQVVDGMAERGWGRIIHIGSVTARRGQVGQVGLATSKAAALGFARALAQEVAARGVTVNTVSPGYITGNPNRGFTPDVIDRLAAPVPMRRLGRPQDVAGVCAWLASEEAAYVTGADYAVNGGLHMG